MDLALPDEVQAQLQSFEVRGALGSPVHAMLLGLQHSLPR